MLNPKQPPNITQSPFSIVTALVDKMRVKTRIQPDQVILQHLLKTTSLTEEIN